MDVREDRRAPLFSIIVPTFNSERFIGPCLDAITDLRAPADEFEILIVDGGSSDRTRGIAATYPDVQVVDSPNVSISDSRNRGARAARGSWLVFIDSDCLVDPRLLEHARRHMESYVCFGAFYKPAPEHGWISRVWLIMEDKPAGPVAWVTAGTLIVKRQIFLELGGFNESLTTGEDVDFGFRLRRLGHAILNDPSMSSVHLGQPDRIRSFFVKEAWRGRSLVPSLREHGLISRPSLFSLAVLGYALAVLLLPIGLLFSNYVVAAVALAALVAAPLFLALRKAVDRGHVRLLPQMTVLCFLYLLARSSSLVKYNQFA